MRNIPLTYQVNCRLNSCEICFICFSDFFFKSLLITQNAPKLPRVQLAMCFMLVKQRGGNKGVVGNLLSGSTLC